MISVRAFAPSIVAAGRCLHLQAFFWPRRIAMRDAFHLEEAQAGRRRRCCLVARDLTLVVREPDWLEPAGDGGRGEAPANVGHCEVTLHGPPSIQDWWSSARALAS